MPPIGGGAALTRSMLFSCSMVAKVVVVENREVVVVENRVIRVGNLISGQPVRHNRFFAFFSALNMGQVGRH